VLRCSGELTAFCKVTIDQASIAGISLLVYELSRHNQLPGFHISLAKLGYKEFLAIEVRWPFSETPYRQVSWQALS
jgi:hypothetical protein